MGFPPGPLVSPSAPNILSDLYQENFVVVSSSYFFSNSVAFPIDSTKPQCWSEELAQISCHVLTVSVELASKSPAWEPSFSLKEGLIELFVASIAFCSRKSMAKTRTCDNSVSNLPPNAGKLETSILFGISSSGIIVNEHQFKVWN